MKNKKLEKIGSRLAHKTIKWMSKYYGKPCKDYSPGCPNCRAYAAFVTLFEDYIKDEKCETQ